MSYFKKIRFFNLPYKRPKGSVAIMVNQFTVFVTKFVTQSIISL